MLSRALAVGQTQHAALKFHQRACYIPTRMSQRLHGCEPLRAIAAGVVAAALLSCVCAWSSCSFSLGNCGGFSDLPYERQRAEFRTYPIEKQLDVYLCMMDSEPPHSELADEIADRGPEAIPSVVAKMKAVKGESDQTNLVYLLEFFSERGHLIGRKDVIADVSAVISNMKVDSVRQRSEESLKKIEIESHIKPFTYTQ